LRQNLERLSALPLNELMRSRYEKFRKLGKFSEEVSVAAPAPSPQ